MPGVTKTSALGPSAGLTMLPAEDGITQAEARRPDLILLDLGLPDRDGLEVIRRVRESSQMPIVVLSARGQETDKIASGSRRR